MFSHSENLRDLVYIWPQRELTVLSPTHTIPWADMEYPLYIVGVSNIKAV